MRLEASKILVQANSGVDVVAERKKAAKEAVRAKTLSELVPVYEFGDEFWSKPRPKSVVEITRYLEKAWLPLHGAPVEKITRQMVKARRDETVSESGPTAANQAHAALSTFFAWAIDREHVSGANPTADIKHRKKSKRTRVLSEAELVDIWKAYDDDDFGRIVKLLMLTSQRRQEIGGLEWSEILVARRQIELPAARCKNKQPHIVPLSEPALEFLQGLPSGRFVFGHFTSWGRGKRWLDRRAPLPQWTIHDIRRSVVTHPAELGFAQPHVIEAIVNHVSGSKAGVAGVYNRATYLPEKRQALEQWAAYLTGLVSAPLSPDKCTNHEKSEEIGGQLPSGT